LVVFALRPYLETGVSLGNGGSKIYLLLVIWFRDLILFQVGATIIYISRFPEIFMGHEIKPKKRAL